MSDETIVAAGEADALPAREDATATSRAAAPDEAQAAPERTEGEPPRGARAKSPGQAWLAVLLQRLAPAALPLAIFVVCFVGLERATLWWPGDIDEGFYSVAAELASHRRMVYRDFFYPQAPVLPYLLGAIVRVVGPSFVALRVALAALGAGTATLVAYSVLRETRSRTAAFVAAVLLCSHELVWQWLPSIRAYGVASLAIVAALVLVSDAKRPPAWWRCLVAGALVALAPLSRLLLAPAVVGVVVAASLNGARFVRVRTVLLVALIVHFGWREQPIETLRPMLPYVAAGALVVLASRRPWGQLKRALLTLVGAAAMGALVVLPHYRAARDGLLFGNVEYHMLRNFRGAYSPWDDAKSVMAAMVGGGAYIPRSAAGTQFAILLALNLVGLLLPGGRLRAGVFVTAVGVTMFNLRPNPIFEHYFTPVAVVLALGAGSALGHVLRSLREGPATPDAPFDPLDGAWSVSARTKRVAIGLGLVGAYMLAGLSSYRRKTEDGVFDPWPMGHLLPADIDEARRIIRRAAAEHPGPVLAPWEGSTFGLALRVPVGFENHFARDVADRVTPVRRDVLRLGTHGEFIRMVATREPSVLVIDRIVEGDAANGLRGLYRENGYRLYARGPSSTEVWVREPR